MMAILVLLVDAINFVYFEPWSCNVTSQSSTSEDWLRE